ncbi:hypothetical protein GQ457_07G000150 [Hibiscus cannabinus]
MESGSMGSRSFAPVRVVREGHFLASFPGRVNSLSSEVGEAPLEREGRAASRPLYRALLVVARSVLLNRKSGLILLMTDGG